MAVRTFLVTLLFTLACTDEPRFGVVDVQQAFQRSPLVMVSAHRIKTDLGGRERELKRRGRALAEARMQLAHGGDELDAEQRARAEAWIAQETASLVEDQREYRVVLQAAQQQRGEELIDQVREMAREVARSEDVTLLLLEQGRLYLEDGTLYTGDVDQLERVDLTEDVARAILEKINPTEIPASAGEPGA